MARSTESSIVTKCAKVMDLLSAAREPLAFSQIVEETGFVKSSCHRILAVLQGERLITYDKDARTYSTGSRLRDWARSAWHRLDLQEVAKDVMNDLSEDTRMNTALSILDGATIFYLRTTDFHPIRHASRAGDNAPIHGTAAGKVFLAHMGPKRQAETLDALKYEVFTEFTKTTPDALRAEFPSILQDGYARAIREEFLSIMGMAAPVRNAQDQVAACISLWTRTENCSEAEFLRLSDAVVSAANEVSARIGWLGRVQERA